MKRVAWAWVAVCLVVFPGMARAAGYWVSEIGPKAIGRGGAFVASPDDPTAMWLNPAGLSLVPGAQIYVDTSLVRLNQQFTRSCTPSCAPNPYTVDYDGNTLTVPKHPLIVDGESVIDPYGPNGGFADGDRSGLLLGNKGEGSVGTAVNGRAGPMQGRFGRWVPFLSMSFNGELLGVPGLGLGAAVYGPNTGGVQYADDGVQRYSVITSEPFEMFTELAVAYRFNRYIGLGVGLALDRLGTHQRVALSTDKRGTEAREKDVIVDFAAYENFIPTMMVGFTSNPVAGLHVGGSFLTPRKARATGPLKVTPNSNLNDPNDPDSLGLTFDDSHARAVGYFGSPAAARLGARYDFAPWFDFEVAVVREFWSQMRYVRLDIEGLDARTTLQPDKPLALPPTLQPKEWRDTWSLRAGGDFNVWPGVATVRAGTFVEESAIPDRTYDVTVADGRKLGVSTGFTVGYFGLRLVGAWQHVFIEAREITDSRVVSQNPVGVVQNMGGNTVVALGRYYQSHDVGSVGVVLDVGEMALRLKGVVSGDRGWWRPEGPRSRTVLDAGSYLQRSSNF
ncbi:MAG: outer membrane protein transport protein [Deltaproteobacteria bacterium]|nr:outer membrane protein transport protein [Deltaproteobacteria bacterium]